MAKEPEAKSYTDEQLLDQATKFFERLNQRAQATPALPELGDEAKKALASFQATVARLEVLKPE